MKHFLLIFLALFTLGCDPRTEEEISEYEKAKQQITEHSLCYVQINKKSYARYPVRVIEVLEWYNWKYVKLLVTSEKTGDMVIDTYYKNCLY